MMRRGAAAARRAHNSEVAGSSPAAATVWNGGKWIRDENGILWLVVWTGPTDGQVQILSEDD